VPSNAVTVVVGDVTAAEVFAIARETYGKLQAKSLAPALPRAEDPPARAARRLTLADPRVASPLLYRVYSVPSYLSGDRRDALSLDLLATILSHRTLGRLAVSLPEDLASVDGGYSGQKRDSGQLALVLVGTRIADPAILERHLDDVIAAVCASGISEEEKDTAVSILTARRSFDLDDQLELARTYAETLALGGRATDVESFETELRAVTAADVQHACKTNLVPEHSVTGMFLPLQSRPANSAVSETARSRQ
jgi:zinc protease